MVVCSIVYWHAHLLEKGYVLLVEMVSLLARWYFGDSTAFWVNLRIKLIERIGESDKGHMLLAYIVLDGSNDTT